jgi:hypothetical protein
LVKFVAARVGERKRRAAGGPEEAVMTTRRVYERSATHVRRSAYHTDWHKPEASAKQKRIFEAVWNELRPDALLQEREDALRDEITRRVAMYSESGLKESNRIANAVLHSFGRVAG